MATTTVPFTIDSVLTGMLAFPDSPDLYRIRLQPEHAGAGGPTIKYLTAPNSSKTFTGPDAHIRRLNNLAFDTVPAGDWIIGRLVAVAATATAEKGGDNAGKLELVSTETASVVVDTLNDLGLCSAEPVWCNKTVDERDCQENTTTTTRQEEEEDEEKLSVPKPTDIQCMDYPSARIIPAPPGVLVEDAQEGGEEEVVVRVTDWVPGHWAGIESDARAYQAIQSRDPGLAPRFLAHVAENNGSASSRVIGFLLERINKGGVVREAGPAELGECRAVLARLHALGFLKGNTLSRHSFLVREDGSVLIQGPFNTAAAAAAAPEDNAVGMKKAEMESLENVLAQSPSVFEDQSARMLRLVDAQRMKVLGEFERAHGFVVPFVYWQETREGGGRITVTLEQHGILAKEHEENGFRWTGEFQEQAEKRFGPSVKGI
ncbi:hypothetical protein C8A00DRAFT_14405 [Chaetomidium leptoderma]|uniref:Uncharacterized protein n=1 Tax=Chaetomidium leptoderma TaxID=669021 RepID=A0AAN6ZWE9_9PEZI|nr:hypothetical protein C8A00DRAFT_14405 [Chaetomidium leptoderma]